MKIDWKRKLSSRKLWLAITNFIANILVIVNVPENEIAQIVAIIMGAGGLIAYIFTEGWVDASREGADVYIIEEEEEVK